MKLLIIGHRDIGSHHFPRKLITENTKFIYINPREVNIQDQIVKEFDKMIEFKTPLPKDSRNLAKHIATCKKNKAKRKKKR